MLDLIFLNVIAAVFAVCVAYARGLESDLTMATEYGIGLAVAVLVTVYLVYALLKPERF